MNASPDRHVFGINSISNLGDVPRCGAAEQERVAVVDLSRRAHGREFTYDTFVKMAGGVASYLRSRGLAKGARAAIASSNRVEYLASYFGIMQAGCVAVPLNTKLPPSTLNFIFQDAEIELVFADAEHRDLLPATVPLIDFDATGDDGFAALVRPQGFASMLPGPEDLAEMLYTSGSSGVPKGVPLTHAGQLWAVQVLAAVEDPGDHRHIVAQPLYHMNGIVVSSLALASGATLILQPRFSSDSYVRAIAEYHVDMVSAIPTMWSRALAVVEAAEGDLSSVKAVSLGSAPVTTELLRRTREACPGISISISYGTTEAGPTVFGPHPDGIPAPDLALGYPLPGNELRLVRGTDPDTGVLQMRNPAVMRGYHRRPELTQAVLMDGWYDSRDVMRRDANGFYYFIGREDDMFVCSGENIYPGEVEGLLEGHPGIRQVVVVPLVDADRGQMPVAFVVPTSAGSVTPESARDFALANGAAYLHPRRVKVIDQLPLAGTNKIDRSRLRQMAAELEEERGWAAL